MGAIHPNGGLSKLSALSSVARPVQGRAGQGRAGRAGQGRAGQGRGAGGGGPGGQGGRGTGDGQKATKSQKPKFGWIGGGLETAKKPNLEAWRVWKRPKSQIWRLGGGGKGQKTKFGAV